MAGDSDGAHQRSADCKAPNQQIRQKEPPRRLAQVTHRAFQERIAGRQLPPRQSFVQDKFEERSQQHRPENCRAQLAAGKGAGRQIARADAGGRNQNARADQRQQAKLFSGHVHRRANARRPPTSRWIADY